MYIGNVVHFSSLFYKTATYKETETQSDCRRRHHSERVIVTPVAPQLNSPRSPEYSELIQASD